MNRDPAPTRRRWRRLRWIATIVLILLGTGGALAYHILTEPARVRRFAERWLRHVCTTDVRLGEVEFSLFDGLRVTGVSIAAPGDSPSAPPLATCSALRLRFDPLAALTGRVRVASLKAEQISASAVFDPAKGRFDVQDILRLPRSEPGSSGPNVADIDIDDLHLQLFCRTERAPETVDTLRVAVHGAAAGDDVYRFTWKSRQALRDDGGTLELDLKRHVLRETAGGSPWLSLATVRMVLEAAAAETASPFAEYGLSGRIRTQGWLLNWDEGLAGLSQLNLEFAQLGFSIPMDDAERALPLRERYVRVEGAAGRIELDDRTAKARLDGKFRGARCNFVVAADGPLRDGGGLAGLNIDLRMGVKELVLPRCDAAAPAAESLFVNRWSRLRHFYLNFDPHGPADVDVHVTHRAGGGWELAGARLAPQGMDSMHRAFPYRIGDLHGEVLLDAGGIHIERLTGRHEDGVVDIEGWVSGEETNPGAEVYFNAYGLPLTDELCDALPGRYRTAWERFGPQGYSDVDVRLAKDAHDQTAPWMTQVDAELQSVDAAFDAFAYPLRDLHGDLHVEHDTLETHGVQGTAGLGPVHIDGVAHLHATGLEALDLRVVAERVPLDEQLRAALPPEALKQVAVFDPAGSAAFDAHLTWTPDAKEINYDINVALQDVSIRHVDLPVPIDDIAGRMRLRPADVEIEGVAGRAAGGAVEVSGRLQSADSRPFGDVDVRCRDMQLDAAARAALPADVRAALADWQVEGGLSLEGGWARAEAENGPGRFRARMPLSGVTLRYAGFPIPMFVQAGDLTLDGERVVLNGVRGGADGAKLAVGGEIDWGRDVRVDLRFTAADAHFTEAVRTASPWRVQRLWNDVKPKGTVGVRGGHIGYVHSGGGGPPEWSVEGELVLEDAAFAIGPVLRNITGSVTFAGTGRGALNEIPLRGTLTLAEVDAGAWPLRTVQGPFARDGGAAGRWLFPSIQGTVFGGPINGRLEVLPQANATRYELNATIQNAQLADLANAWRVSDAPAGQVTGRIGARLFLTGASGDPGGLRGGGRINLRDGQLYHMPLLLSILNVVNLTQPEHAAFQEGDAEFYIVGPQLQLRSLMLKGPALALTGDGRMNLDTKALDLRVVATSPHEWARVPVVTPLIEGAVRELIEVQVTGTPAQPITTARPLRRVEGAVDALMSPKQ